MDADLAMALGVVLGVLSVPSILSAMAEARAPRVGAVLLVLAGALIVWAVVNNPGGYSFADLPAVLLEVGARYLP